MSSVLRVEIPGLPPTILRGNTWTATNGARWARRNAATEWGLTGHYAIVDARNRSGCPKYWMNLERIMVLVMFVLPTNRRIDLDNLEGQAMKPIWDAMVKDNLITDDRWQVVHPVTYDAMVDKERGPMTILEVTHG